MRYIFSFNKEALQELRRLERGFKYEADTVIHQDYFQKLLNRKVLLKDNQACPQAREESGNTLTRQN